MSEMGAPVASTPGKEEEKKPETRVFKKTSPNGKITTYLGKRDFIDRGDTVDLIDGMVLIDDEYIRDNKKVSVNLLAAFRYGREDLDVLGLTFRKDLIAKSCQVYPIDPNQQRRALTSLQERLSRKLGSNAYPFWFDIPPNCASSVTLQPAPGDTGKPCGVDYELKTFVGGQEAAVNGKNRLAPNTVRLAIRKLTYAPYEPRPQPMVDVSKEFMMSPGLLHMEASLDKEMYYHGESIAVNVHLQNNSNKTVKKLKVSVMQVADICLFTTASYTCEVARLDSTDGCPVGPGGTLSKVFSLCPLLKFNKEKRGLALDGQLKHEDTNLASSTIMNPRTPKENYGIMVQYKVKIKAITAGIGGKLGGYGELVAELPFTLTHAKPVEAPAKKVVEKKAAPPPDAEEEPNPLDFDLIQLDEDCEIIEEDDLIFEDFTRLRLKGGDSSEDAPTSSNSLI